MPDQQRVIRMMVVGQRNGSAEGYSVGTSGITQIEEVDLPGMFADIPYLRVWRGEAVVAEFCRHNIVGIYFNESTSTNQESKNAAVAA